MHGKDPDTTPQDLLTLVGLPLIAQENFQIEEGTWKRGLLLCCLAKKGLGLVELAVALIATPRSLSKASSSGACLSTEENRSTASPGRCCWRASMAWK